MHPETRKWRFSCKVFRLRNLTSMMRKGQVHATTVNVQLRTKVAHRHCATFNMPAGATWPPWAGPCWFTWSLGLPENKIERVSLARIIREVSALICDSEHSMIIV